MVAPVLEFGTPCKDVYHHLMVEHWQENISRHFTLMIVWLLSTVIILTWPWYLEVFLNMSFPQER